MSDPMPPLLNWSTWPASSPRDAARASLRFWASRNLALALVRAVDTLPKPVAAESRGWDSEAARS